MKNNKKGFTLIELVIVISLLVVIAGIFTVSFTRTLKNQRNEENENIISQIISAASAYVSVNPNEIENLFNGYGYVDIPIGNLRDSGLLSEELKNSETGEIISDDDLVRVKLESGDNLDFKYPVETETEAWKLVLESLNVDFGDMTSDEWCQNYEVGENATVYKGLITDPSDSSYSSWKSRMYLMSNRDSRMYTGNYFATDGMNLRVTSCNVNPQKVGTYNITYKYNDVDLGTVKTANRVVYVNSSKEDVAAFSIILNKGTPIVRGTDRDTVPVLIKIVYKNGADDIETTIGELESQGYNIAQFDTEVVGDSFEALVTRTISNSDGSVPDSQKVKYTVIPDVYTLTFNPGSGTVDPKSKRVTYKQDYGDLPIPIRTGYDFVGWYSDLDRKEEITSETKMMTLADHTVYAKWEAKTFTVVLNPNGGSLSTQTSISVVYDSTYGNMPTPTKTGYKFSGWYTSVSGGTQISSNTVVSILSNQTLYAHWVPESYTVSFNTNGGSISQTSKSVTYNSTYGVLPTPYRSSYTFNGWYTASGTRITSSSKVNTAGSHTLYAQWTYNPPVIPTVPTIIIKPQTPSGTSICDIECQMKKNSDEWYKYADDHSEEGRAKRKELHDANVELAKQLEREKESTYQNGLWVKKDGCPLYTMAPDQVKQGCD